MSALPYDVNVVRPPQIGLVVLQSDETLEHDLRRLLPPEAELLVTRIPSASEVSSDSLAAMAREITQAATLLPRGAELSVVGFGCTSGTAEIGAAQVAELIRKGVQTAAVTDPVTALKAACAHLNITRLALVSPYVAEVSARLRGVLTDSGITITAFASFEEAQEARVVRISPASLHDAALSTAAQAPCDAVFLSCTNLRTLDVISGAEAALNLPVLSSNLVMAWHMTRLAGLTVSGRGVGALWLRPVEHA